MAKKGKQPKEKKPKEKKQEKPYYGIAEWYGSSFEHMSAKERRSFADYAIKHLNSSKDTPDPSMGEIKPCPFRRAKGACNKKGGVCSLRLYKVGASGTDVEVIDDETGGLTAICPDRLEQNSVIFRSISLTVLKHDDDPIVLGQIPFLKKVNRGATVQTPFLSPI